jgi:hypothetical protein
MKWVNVPPEARIAGLHVPLLRDAQRLLTPAAELMDRDA